MRCRSRYWGSAVSVLLNEPPDREDRFVKTSTFVVFGAALSACTPQAEWEQSSGAPAISWEAFFAGTVPHRGGYLLEGDIFFGSEESLRDYYDRTFGAAAGGLASAPDGASYAKWPEHDRRRISYCIDPANFSNVAWAQYAMHAAARAWEQRVDVDFYHDKAEDGSGCTNANTNVLFNVRAEVIELQFTPQNLAAKLRETLESA